MLKLLLFYHLESCDILSGNGYMIKRKEKPRIRIRVI